MYHDCVGLGIIVEVPYVNVRVSQLLTPPFSPSIVSTVTLYVLATHSSSPNVYPVSHHHTASYRLSHTDHSVIVRGFVASVGVVVPLVAFHHENTLLSLVGVGKLKSSDCTV